MNLRDHWFLGFGNLDQFGLVTARLVIAWFLGGVIGYNRERAGKAAGLRTHMLVASGTALFVLVPIVAGVERDALMRVVQGIAAGVGFLGAGVILKMPEERRISGVTTAADIWVTAAVGAAVGMGFAWPAILTILLCLVTLIVLRSFGR